MEVLSDYWDDFFDDSAEKQEVGSDFDFLFGNDVGGKSALNLRIWRFYKVASLS